MQCTVNDTVQKIYNDTGFRLMSTVYKTTRISREIPAFMLTRFALHCIYCPNEITKARRMDRVSYSTRATPPTPFPLDVNLRKCPKIPGPRDLAVKSYSEWQEANVFDEMLKADFQKACEVAIAYGPDLEQVHEDQNPDFFTQNGVRLGISRRFVGDIIDWATQYASDVHPEGSPSRLYN